MKRVPEGLCYWLNNRIREVYRITLKDWTVDALTKVTSTSSL